MSNRVKAVLKGALFAALLAGVLFISPRAVFAENATYYVDAAGGDDSYAGTGEGAAWKTLAKVNGTTFQPGDRILLKAGCTWYNEQLHPLGSGTAGNPIIVDSYGTGDKPAISCGGSQSYAVYLNNQQYWEINNLNISNTAPSVTPGNLGILVQASDVGVVNHIYLKDLDVHDVNSNSVNKDGGGIIFKINGSATRTRFNDILVEGCTIKNVNRTGLSIGKTSWYTDFVNASTENYLPDHLTKSANSAHTNIVVRNNYVEHTGGDGIVVQFSRSPLVEYNVANSCAETSASASPEQYSAGIWPWLCDDAVFQYNEVYDTRFNGDGQSYDCDYSCGTIYQYNYSHDNEGGFMLLCGTSSLGSVIRYNISQGDLVGLFRPQTGATGTIYNNTFYLLPEVEPFRLPQSGMNFTVKNNIFYHTGDATSPNWRESYGFVYSNNCYYGFNNSAQDNGKITADPRLAGPGSGATGIDTVDGYKLTSASPCINAGAFISNNGGKDYWGNSLYGGSPDIGVCESPYGVPSDTNLVAENSGFEEGLDGWTDDMGTAEIVTDAYSGSNAVKLTGNEDRYEAVYRTITGLSPNTYYRLTAYAKESGGSEGKYIYAANYGGTTVATEVTSTQYSPVSLTFKTGAGNTSVEIGIEIDLDENDSVYMDEVSLNAVASPLKSITAFNFTSLAVNGVIDESSKTIILNVPFGVNVSALTPTILHTGEGISPASGVAQDFTNPLTYTVTAADGTTSSYTATVTYGATLTNLLTNGDFETGDLTGWGFVDSFTSMEASRVYTGNYAVKLAGNAPAQGRTYCEFPAAEGDVFTMSALAYSSSAGYIFIGLQTYDSNGAAMTGAGKVEVQFAEKTYTYKSATLTAPAGAVKIRFYIGHYQGGTSPLGYLDNIAVVRGSVAMPQPDPLAYPASPQSTLTADKTTVTANGTDAATVTVTLKNSAGTALEGREVALSQGAGSSVITAMNATTDSDGRARFTAKSTSGDTEVIYKAKDVTDNVTLAGSLTITFETPEAPPVQGAADYTLEIGAESTGGAGQTRSITIGGTAAGDLDGKYLIIQFTKGTGSTAKVSLVMISPETQTVTVSYEGAGTRAEAWLAGGMPDLTEEDISVDIYAYTSSNQ